MLLGKAVTRVNWGRALVLAVVVALHLIVLRIPWRALVQPLPNQPSNKVARPDRSPTIVFLLEPSAPFAIKARREDPQTEARPTRHDRVRERPLAASIYGDEVSNAASKAATAPLAPATHSSLAASGEAPKPIGPSLDLRLSREALKSFTPSLAARSSFQGSLPVTVERGIAQAAAETGAWTEERVDIDHVRLRRGTTCVILSRPQIAKTDPFSDSSHRVPWGASQPSECR